MACTPFLPQPFSPFTIHLHFSLLFIVLPFFYILLFDDRCVALRRGGLWCGAVRRGEARRGEASRGANAQSRWLYTNKERFPGVRLRLF